MSPKIEIKTDDGIVVDGKGGVFVGKGVVRLVIIGILVGLAIFFATPPILVLLQKVLPILTL